MKQEGKMNIFLSSHKFCQRNSRQNRMVSLFALVDSLWFTAEITMTLKFLASSAEAVLSCKRSAAALTADETDSGEMFIITAGI